MQYKTFSLPAGSSESAEETLNAFLRSNKIISVNKEFVSAEKCWCFLVEYITENAVQKNLSKIDYMKVLSQEDFALFSKLREVRKKSLRKKKFQPMQFSRTSNFPAWYSKSRTIFKKMQKMNGIGTMKAQKRKTSKKGFPLGI